MRNKKISIKTVIIIVLILVIISLIFIILNMKNKNIEEQKIIKEKLEKATTDSSYIALSTHISELDEKQQEINNIQNTAGQATATAGQILKNYTSYKDGKLITGTMANNGALNWNPSSSTSKTITAGYYSGGTISTTNAYNTGYTNGVNSVKNLLTTAAPHGIPTIPIMTSTTEPSGNITSSNLKNGYNNTINCFNESGQYCYAGINGYIQYEFQNITEISTIGFNISNYYGGGQTYYFSILSSLDGTNYSTLYSNSYTDSRRVYVELEKPVNLKYIKFICTNGVNSDHGCGFTDIQCYKSYDI